MLAKSSVCFLVVLFLCLSPAFSIDSTFGTSWGKSVEPIRLGVKVAKNPPATTDEIFVYIENESKDQLAILNLGYIIGNGISAFYSSLRMRAVNVQGESRVFQYAPPLAAVAGRRDPMIIPLMGGAMYASRLDLKRFIEDATGQQFSSLPSGRYRVVISLEATPVSKNEVNGAFDVALLKFWVGLLQTGEVEITVE